METKHERHWWQRLKRKQKTIAIRLHIEPTIETNNYITFDSCDYVKYFTLPMDPTVIHDLTVKINVHPK